MKSVSILGSTGSIGCNALKVIEFLHEPQFRVAALGAGENVGKLAEQIKKFQPEIVAVKNEECAAELLAELHTLGVSAPPRIETGEKGLIAVGAHEQSEILIAATVGAVGLVPTLKALEQGKRVCLANKETLVMAGGLVTETARKNNAELLPIDSEHTALHECLRGESPDEVKRLILTASGGPFRTKTADDIKNATVEEALNHPNWKMGAKITIDSATLMNKGFEVHEARWLFGFGAEKIAVVVHPQSVVHSLVEMTDGSVIAQLGTTDMRHAIQYALTFPRRRPNEVPPLDLAKMSALTFEEPDLEKFPCLALAFRALDAGGTLPCAMNAANEIAVQAFLEGKIKLSAIPEIIEKTMNAHQNKFDASLEEILNADCEARRFAEDCLRENAV